MSAASAPYEIILRSGNAEAVLRDGWRHGQSLVRVDGPIDWSFPGDARRSENFHLHALDLIDSLLEAWSSGRRDEGYLEAALSVALDWARTHPTPDTPDRSPMAWYDMAVGVRAYRLAYVFDEARRAGLGAPADLDLLRASLDEHRRKLADDGFFAAHSNHGFFQACGQMAMGRRLADLPGMVEARAQGAARFAEMIRTQFSSEGVHKEHSPAYHRSVVATICGLRDAGFVGDPELVALVDRAVDQTWWFVKPDGVIANFGDTDEDRIDPAKAPRAAQDAEATCKAFPESGYFVVRTEQGYLAQTLAHHSRTHKQADDLSFIWFEQGRDLLVDAGRFGYRGRTKPGDPLWSQGFWYADPNRVYVESTHAHNTVEIDGRPYDRKRSKPYGSALRHAGQDAQGLYYSQGRVAHGEVVHERLLLHRAGEWLLVLDRLTGRGRHHYQQWFHLAPDFEVRPEGGGFQAAAPDGVRLQIAPLLAAERSEVFVGAEQPRLQGWRSPAAGRMEPAPAMGFVREGAGVVGFATLLRLGAPLTSVTAEVDPAAARFDLAWSADGGGVELAVDWPAEGAAQVAWRQRA